VALPEADIYVLKYIIHDWDDEQGVLILSNCARALRSGGRVILVEAAVPEDDRPSIATLPDRNMLVQLPGRERAARQYSDLLARADLRLNGIIGTSSPLSVIEASAA
jgi:hypothetical protein